MYDLKKTLMVRDGITEAEAEELVEEVRQEVRDAMEEGDMERAMNACEIVGLEPDYLDSILLEI